MPPKTTSTSPDTFLSAELPRVPPAVITNASTRSNPPMFAEPVQLPVPLLTVDRGSSSSHAQHIFGTAPLAPLTPPPIIHRKPPYRCIPLPPQTGTNTAVSIHPVLEAPRPLINFDLSLPPSSITTPQCHDRCLIEPATYPTLPSLAVICSLLPWAISVHASTINPSFVTVADVLGTICRAVHLGVTEAEFEHLASSPEAYRDQGYRPRGAYRQGMIRLDLFEGKNRFMGLSKSSIGWDTWELNVE
jgi:hypothetical protein